MIASPRLALAAAVLLCAAPLHAEPFSDIKASISYNDNLSYGNYGYDVLDDTITSLSYSRGYPQPAGEFGILSYMLGAGVDVYANYGDLNTVGVEGGAFYKSKLGIGPTVPWYQVGGTLGYQAVSDGRRDAMLLKLSANLGKRFSEEASAKLMLGYSQKSADNKTFDGSMLSLGLGGDYLLNDDWLLFASFTRYSGEVVATTTPNAYIIQQSDAITADKAYGQGRFAYRLDGETDAFELGANYYLSDNSSLELVYSQRDTSVGYYTSYSSNIYTLNYLYSY